MAAGETHRRLKPAKPTNSPSWPRNIPYLQMGFRAAWIVDPASRTGREGIGDAWIAAETLEVSGTPIWVNLSKLFSDLGED